VSWNYQKYAKRKSFGVPGLQPYGANVTILLLIALDFLSNSQRFDKSFICSQTFHNYFFKGLETASAKTELDADMRKDTLLATTAFVALATFALSGCGADDSASGPPSSTSPASLTSAALNNVAAQSATMVPATGMPNASESASAPLTADPAAASDPITQSMQASLAADSRQVAPLMHYAPGDNTSSN
jgi:hypothetical protein